MLKKRLTILSTLVIFNLVVSMPIIAQSLSNVGTNFQIPNVTRYADLEDIINALTSLIRPVFIITFGAMVFYGGWVRLTSQGNPDKIKSSSQIIIAAIIGFSIAVFAPTLVELVGRLIGVQGGLIG
jgi:hypothetical protein